MSSYFGMFVLLIILVIIAYIIGYGVGVRHVLEKLYAVLDFDTYRYVITELHYDVENNKEDTNG